jgi:hypothetical protein
MPFGSADPTIKIKIELDASDAKVQVQTIGKEVQAAGTRAAATGQSAGSLFGTGFSKGASSALSSGLQGLKSTISGLGGPLGAAFSAGESAISGLTGAISALGPVTAVAAGGVIALAGAFTALGAAAVSTGSRLHDLSIVSGISVKDLDALRNIEAESGVKLESISQSILKFQSTVLNNTSKSKAALEVFGKTTADLRGDVVGTFLDILKSSDKMGESADKNAALFALFGKKTADMKLIAEALPATFDEVRKKVEESGNGVSTAWANAADKVGDKSADLKLDLQRALESLGSSVFPFFTAVLEDMDTILKAMQPFLVKTKHWLDQLALMFDNWRAEQKTENEGFVNFLGVKIDMLNRKQREQINQNIQEQKSVMDKAAQDAEGRTMLPPKPRGKEREFDPSKFKAAKEVKDTQKELRAAQREADKEELETTLKLQNDFNKRTIDDLQDSYRLGLIDLKAYYAERQALTRDSAINEITRINSLIHAREEELKAVPADKAAERLKIQTDINKLMGDLTVAQRTLNGVEYETQKAVAGTNQVRQEQVKLLQVATREQQVLSEIREKAALREASAVFQESESLKKRIADLDEILQDPSANFALRVEVAQKEAIAAIVDADQKATLQMVQDAETLADARIYHSTRAQAILLNHLAQQKSVTEAVGDAMVDVFEGVTGALDRGIGKLTARLGLFGNAVKDILSAITRQVIATLTAAAFGVGTGAQGGLTGALFGGQAAQGALGRVGGIAGLGSVLTGGFAGGPGAGGVFGGAGGGMLQLPGVGGVPAGILSTIGIQPSATSQSGLQGIIQKAANAIFGQGGATGSAGAAGLQGIINSIGGLGPALIGGFAGAQLGGASTAGKILGGIGGAVAGIGAGIAGTAFALGAPLLVALAPLAGAALIAAPLIIAAILLGKAAQRKKDEKTADTYWVAYKDTLIALTQGVNSDQIDGASALQQAETARAAAISQINTIQTASVRQSRLAHQIPDVDNIFLEPLKRAVERQRLRQERGQLLRPEFATGGVVPGLDQGRDSVVAMLRPGEVVLNRQQQRALGGPQALRRAGVPGFGTAMPQTDAFAAGGLIAGAGLQINLDVVLNVSEDEAGSIFVAGASTEGGQAVTVRTVKRARRNGEL